ncbi:hypothetical protein TBLA_0E00350 [Henningerozyma blattae CBS 6284]|uniref:Outer spore wall assembly protein SHE10 n=1 Tax=Henningerozyma blattae (strain ATCC 34711 / CBS 6284 / DSM 70876 / NBRC 10599 / NRRL Y-10934 / UCD 77-7) TaxID=1071380 RepID=I2H3Z4_HENB6|nr:hypothetical protein TBLA_0E00350 [Tetrapisispora blattae CBS 6284]CCH61096.1 hypothetical protein TBLA_0E00350 [Tetrapisispora blattae CBS 6284]
MRAFYKLTLLFTLWALYWQNYKCPASDHKGGVDNTSLLCDISSVSSWHQYFERHSSIYRREISPAFQFPNNNTFLGEDGMSTEVDKVVLVQIRDWSYEHIILPIKPILQKISNHIDWDKLHEIYYQIQIKLKLYYNLNIIPIQIKCVNFWLQHEMFVKDLLSKTGLNCNSSKANEKWLIQFLEELIFSIKYLCFKIYFFLKEKIQFIQQDYLIATEMYSSIRENLSSSTTASLLLTQPSASLSLLSTGTSLDTFVTSTININDKEIEIILDNDEDKNNKNINVETHLLANDVINLNNHNYDKPVGLTVNLPDQESIQQEFELWYNSINRKSENILKIFNKDVDEMMKLKIETVDPELIYLMENLTALSQIEFSKIVKTIQDINCTCEVNNSSGEIIYFDRTGKTQLAQYITRQKIASIFDTTKILIKNKIDEINDTLLDLIKEVQKEVFDMHEDYVDMFEEWGDIMITEWSKRMAYFDIISSNLNIHDPAQVNDDDDELYIEDSSIDDIEIENDKDFFHNNWSKFVKVKKELIKHRDDLVRYEPDIEIIEEFLKSYQNEIDLIVYETKEYLHILRARSNVSFELREREEKMREMAKIEKENKELEERLMRLKLEKEKVERERELSKQREYESQRSKMLEEQENTIDQIIENQRIQSEKKQSEFQQSELQEQLSLNSKESERLEKERLESIAKKQEEAISEENRISSERQELERYEREVQERKQQEIEDSIRQEESKIQNEMVDEIESTITQEEPKMQEETLEETLTIESPELDETTKETIAIEQPEIDEIENEIEEDPQEYENPT